MEYIIGIIVGVIFTTLISAFRRSKEAQGTFNIVDIPGENSTLGVSFTTQITEKTNTIVLHKQSRK